MKWAALLGLALAPSCLLAAGPGRAVFGFSPTQLHNWYQFYGLTGPRPKNAPAPPPPTTVTGVHVLVSGNFGATFSVSGAGTGLSPKSDDFIDISTNRGLSIQAAGFGGLQLGGASAAANGSITYEMQIYSGTGTSLGSAVTGTVSGQDSGFNGKSLVITVDAVPSDGRIALRLSRTVQLTQLARGGEDYRASGTLLFSIN